MKLITIITITSLALPFAVHGDEEEKKPVIAKKPTTHKEIAAKQKEQADKKAEKHGDGPIKPIVTVKKRSLIANSSLLASGGDWTLIPRGSVIHIPLHLKNKVVSKPKGKLINWKNFLRKNYGWLHVHEIKMTQAQGREKIDQKAIKAYKSIGKIVVATCAKGPISVAPDSLKPPQNKKAENKK